MRRSVLSWLAPLVVAGSLAGCGSAPVAGSSVATLAASAAQGDVNAQGVYPIEGILGIGPVYGQKLRDQAINDTQDLLGATGSRADRQQLAHDAGIPYKLILGWAQMAQVMQIKGIGPAEANLLAAAGVASAKELAQRVPANLSDRLEAANDDAPRPFVKHLPSANAVADWVTEAKGMNASLSNDQ